MDSFFAWLSSNPVAATTLIVAFGVLISSATLIYLVAFLQGREVSFWPPKIGIKPDKTKQESDKSKSEKTTSLLAQENSIAQLADALDAKCQLRAGNTRLDFKKISALLDEQTDEAIIIAQNLRTLLRHDLLDALRPIMEKTGHSKVTIILSVPEFFVGIARSEMEDRSYLEQFATTIQQLNRFKFSLKDFQKPRFQVYFHPGASSLSAIIRDPSNLQRGLIAFTAKWTTDEQPDNRVFCIIDRINSDQLFQGLIGHIPIMTDRAHSLDLEAMSKKVAALCREKGIVWKPL